MTEYTQRMMTLFAGLERAHGSYVYDDDDSSTRNKVSGKAITQAKPVTEALWKDHLAGKKGLGIIPIRDDATCFWACIDVDSYTGDIPAECNAFIAQHGLPLVVCRSKSGGAHVFVFFKEPMHCNFVRTKMDRFATAMGFKGAEVFPKQNKLDQEKNEIGNWLNMPYFDADKTDRYGYRSDGKELSVLEFLDYAESNRLSQNAFAKLQVPEIEHPFEDGPPCLQALSRQKVSEGGRNNAMFQFAVYARKKYGDDWEDKLYEYNHSYFDPPIQQSEMRSTVVKSMDRRDYQGYKCEEQPMASVCNRQECLRRRYGIGGDNREREAAEITQKLSNLRKVVYVDVNDKPLDDDRYWLLNYEDETLKLTTSQLQDSKKFGSKVMEAVNYWPPNIPLHRWRELVVPLLEECQTIHLPLEVSPVSVLISVLRRYIRGNEGADSFRHVNEGQVLERDGYYHIKPEYFFEELQISAGRIDRRTVWQHLQKCGIQRHETTFKTASGKTSKLRCWQVPIELIEEFTLREFKQEGPEF